MTSGQPRILFQNLSGCFYPFSHLSLETKHVFFHVGDLIESIVVVSFFSVVYEIAVYR